MSEKLRISHLDGLRGIAILWVIAYHAYARWYEYTQFFSAAKDISFFKYGFLGVQLFFMISGFVIFMTLDKSANFLQFMKRRWLRLFPAMLVATLLIYLTAPLFYERPAGHPELINALPGLTFISPTIYEIIVDQPIHSLEGSFWSLYIEVIFYIFVGVTYFLLNRKFCIPFLLFGFFGYYLSAIFHNSVITSIVTIIGLQYYGWFIIGCALYEIINERNKLTNSIFATLAGFLIVAAALRSTSPSLVLFNLTIITLFVSSFYFEKIQRVLSTKLLLVVGFVSYPLYLIHENILVSLLIKLHKIGISDTSMYIMPIIITAALALVAYLITKYIEPRIKKTLQQVIKP